MLLSHATVLYLSSEVFDDACLLMWMNREQSVNNMVTLRCTAQTIKKTDNKLFTKNWSTSCFKGKISCDMTSALNRLVLPLLCLFCKTHTPVVTLTFYKGQICATVFIYRNTSVKASTDKTAPFCSAFMFCDVNALQFKPANKWKCSLGWWFWEDLIWIQKKWTGESEKLLRFKRPRMFSQDETTSWKSLLHLRGHGQPWSCSHPICNLSLNKSWWISCTTSF